jgi:hypothetical protein
LFITFYNKSSLPKILKVDEIFHVHL